MKRALISAVLSASVVAITSAQTQPNFSGTWVVESVERSERPASRGADDVARGRGGRGRGLPPGGGGGRAAGPAGGPGDQLPPGMMTSPRQGQRVRIAQTPDRLIVTTISADGEQMMSYALDGSETTNMVGANAIKSRTKWEGVALVTEGAQALEGRGQAGSLTTRDIRSLTEDGRMVVRTTSGTPRGNTTTTVVYVRAE